MTATKQPTAHPALDACAFEPGQRFEVWDEPGEHDPCYLRLPGSAMVPFNHDAKPGVDLARAHWIANVCNAMLADAEADSILGLTESEVMAAAPTWFADPAAEVEKVREIISAASARAMMERALEALSIVLPMAKGYAAAHRVGTNQEKIEHAEAVLADAELAEVARSLCATCGINPADTPRGLCPGCDAYREHQA